MKTTKILKIGKFMISNTEDLAKLVMLKGGQNICDFLNNMKCLKIETDLYTETGVIKWATEDGDLISEKGYHYYKFSECLKKAWANYKLKKAMQTQIVRFYFQKVDGSIREAWGTICPTFIPQISEKERKRNETVQVYFDTEVKEFRCFKKFNLIAK